MSERIESLLAQMTLEEKAGQLNFPVGDLFVTGPAMITAESAEFDDRIRNGTITGLFNIHGAKYTARLQRIAVEESRLKIPLLIGADVIHGFQTMFPIPLAEAASWDIEAIEESARIAARESTAVGINFNFAPMVDIARDARWGRSAEGAGEDPFYGSLVGAARIRGFQGDDLSKPYTVAACVKHIAAYGAAEGGREYNTVDMSERRLREVYLPPYKAAIDAGAATVMTSFNEFDGVPVTASKFLLQDILREEWGFNGMVVSDWASVPEMVIHGSANDTCDAAKQAIEGGTDMDMMGEAFIEHIPQLVQDGKVSMETVDHAVRNVLRLKEKLGLFDDPFRYSDEKREKTELRSRKHLSAAHDMARKSIVLLKNQNQILPLAKEGKSIALIGQLAENSAEMNGCWAYFAKPYHPISFLTGIKEKAPALTINYAEGYHLYNETTRYFDEAIEVAQNSDILVVAVGEGAVMNGEAASRAEIGLPGNQLSLLKELKRLRKPIIALVSCGRGIAIPWLAENADAILVNWALGSEAGRAVADVLFGDYNPSGKLPVTFPRSVGQAPIYYGSRTTGRPYDGDYSEPKSERIYTSKYRDEKNSPLFPFGFGLSYSTFRYSNLQISQEQITAEDRLRVFVDVENAGEVAGEEVVQFYIRDMVGSVTRPVKELKGFKKVKLQSREKQTIEFSLGANDLSFYRRDMTWGYEEGEFEVMIGGSSESVLTTKFNLIS